MKKLHQSSNLDIFSADTSTELEIPLASEAISAGFPSPADDFYEHSIDLNKELIKHPNATFFGRVKGMSMKDAGIFDGDLLVIDKSLEAKHNDIAVCFVNGEFTVKRITIENGKCFLKPENKEFKPIEITEENDFIIWGIVIHVIKSLK